jgi:hypothetical protein
MPVADAGVLHNVVASSENQFDFQSSFSIEYTR